MAAERTSIAEIPQPPIILRYGDQQVEARIGQHFFMHPGYSPDIWELAEVTEEVHTFSTGKKSRVIYMLPVETGPVEDLWYETKLADDGKTILYKSLEMDVASALLESQRKAKK